MRARRSMVIWEALAALIAVTATPGRGQQPVGIPTASQSTPLPPGSSLSIASVPNLRDVGGYKTRDGAVVRYGVAYRSDQLNPISPEDMQKIAALGLKNDFDLRTAEERKERPDQVPPGVTYVWLNVLADATGTSAAEVQRLLAEPNEANKVLGGGKVEELFVNAYREFISLPSAKKAYSQLFAELGSSNDLPSLFSLHNRQGPNRLGGCCSAYFAWRPGVSGL